MREILFRGKRLDTGEWAESTSLAKCVGEQPEDVTYYIGSRQPALMGYNEQGNILLTVTHGECLFYKIDPETVGQFTGLTDTNGKRIFEGDIVKTHYKNTKKSDFVEQVVFHNGRFCAMYSRNTEECGRICQTVFSTCHRTKRRIWNGAKSSATSTTTRNCWTEKGEPMTEQRLIDANALDTELETLMVRFAALGRKRVAEDYNFVRTVLGTAPTVDAVEVVRCKDCKHRIDNGEHVPFCNHPFGLAGYAAGHYFCSYGER